MNKNKKIFYIVMGVVLLIVGINIFTLFLNNNNYILSGYEDSYEDIDYEGITHYTDYCKYIYNDSFDEEFRKVYNKVNKDNLDDIVTYVEYFKDNYDNKKFDFNSTIINEKDYFYLDTKEGKDKDDTKYGKYDDYSLYLYDVETNTLYYIHYND